jgi:cytochrome c oxidase assembly protein subunit 15
MDFAEGFVMWREIGVDYEGGVLDLPSRTAIQVTHRIGAAVVLVLLGFLALRLLGSAATRGSGALLGTVLTVQLALGILNVVLFLPLPNAVAHNAVGALLLATVLRLLYRSGREAG